MSANYENLTKEWALDIMVDRVAKRFPGINLEEERAIREGRSRAVLLYSVAAQMFGDLDKTDDGLKEYAYSAMTADERRVIDILEQRPCH